MSLGREKGGCYTSFNRASRSGGRKTCLFKKHPNPLVNDMVPRDWVSSVTSSWGVSHVQTVSREFSSKHRMEESGFSPNLLLPCP